MQHQGSKNNLKRNEHGRIWMKNLMKGVGWRDARTTVRSVPGRRKTNARKLSETSQTCSTIIVNNKFTSGFWSFVSVEFV